MAELTLILGNIKKKKANFISIFILILMITTALISITSSIISGKNRFHEACIESNSPDAFNRVTMDDYNTDMINKLLAENDIESVDSIKILRYTSLKIKNENFSNSFYLFSLEDTHEKFILKNNHKIKKVSKGEIYLPEYFRTDYNCKIGDCITIKNLSLKISGFFEDTLLGSSSISPKRAIISNEDFNSLANENSSELRNDYLINIYLKDNVTDIPKALDKINNNTHLDNYGYESTFITDLEYYTFLIPNIICSMLIGFSILLFIITMIVISYSINSNIEMDYVSFGILKALGFTNLQIRIILLMQYLSATILGSICGIILSIFLTNSIGSIVLSGTGLFCSSSVNYLASIVIIITILILISLFTILFTKKIIRITPIRAISLGYSPVYFSNKLNFALDKFKFLPLSIKMVWKQIITHTKQYISLIIVITILTFCTISISSLGVVFKNDNVCEMFGEEKIDITINYSNNTKNLIDDIENVINKYSTITNTFVSDATYNSYENKNRLIKIYSKFTLNPIEGRNPKYDNEVLITTLLSEKLHKNIGDTISVIDKEGNPIEYLIVGKNQNISDTGINISMLTSGYKRIDKDYNPNTISVNIANSKKTYKIISKLNKQYKNYNKEDLSFYNNYDLINDFIGTITNSIDSSIYVIYIISILVITLVTIMICNKALYQEKLDIGIFKSQGFSDNELRISFSLRILVITIIATVIGTILNLMFNDNFLSCLLKICGITNFNSSYHLTAIAIPLIIIYTFVSIFSFAVTHKIKKMSPKILISE